jgi:SAM-dependent methyltransferase
MKLFRPLSYIYWQDHIHFVDDNKLAWFGDDATEDFWLHYWEREVNNSEYFQKAYNLDLKTTIEGRIFLDELSLDGYHLEAGCGAGFWVAALNHSGYKTKGIEYSKRIVDLVKSVQPDLPIAYGNALSISCSNNTFDSYISFGVMEHNIDGPQTFLKEAYRVLKPRGKVIISVPYFGFLRRLNSKIGLYSKSKPNLPFFQYGFSKKQFTDLMQKSGFKVTSTHLIGITRLLTEEIYGYRWLTNQKGGYYIRKLIAKLFSPFDGHMIIFIGFKTDEVN